MTEEQPGRSSFPRANQDLFLTPQLELSIPGGIAEATHSPANAGQKRSGANGAPRGPQGEREVSPGDAWHRQLPPSSSSHH